jgi:hypothetical protein
MITRPTTPQIIEDCRRELLEVIRPELTSETALVSVEMLDAVLRNCATRASGEIAWMTAESAAMVNYARDVASALDEDESLVAALETFDSDSGSDLDLETVTVAYALAGEAFSCALEAAISAGDEALSARAAGLLRKRVERETEIMGEYAMVGRG